MALVIDMQFVSSAPVKTDHVDNFFGVIASVYADFPILLRLSTAVMATKSRHVSEVMATVQISVVAEENEGADPFFGIGSFLMQNMSKATILRLKYEKINVTHYF